MLDVLRNFWGSSDRIVVVSAEAHDVKHLADIHSASFRRGWSDGEFEALLSQDAYTCHVARIAGRPEAPPLGFVLAKQVLDEAEIITIAVSPASRKRGLGGLLMDDVIRRLQTDRVASLFLEVDEANGPAISLYRKLGFSEADRRDGYYAAGQEETEAASAALVMRLDLG